jgi:hypothetical protein
MTTAHRKLRVGLFISLIILVILGVAVYAYFAILPNHEDKQYLTAVQPAYNLQRAQMLLAYKSYSSPLFSGNNATLTSDSQDLSEINTVISKASSLTNTLSAKDNLNVLPGTQNFKAVKQTNAQYVAMEQYVNDSKTFLANYQGASTYVSKLANLEKSVQLTAFFNAMTTVDKATTAAQLLSTTTSASTDLGSSITALNALNPPTDFQQVSASLVTKLNNANNDFIDIISGINGENSEQVTNTIKLLDQIATPLNGVSDTTVASMLPAHSLLSADIQKLQGEHPLQ